MENVVSSQSKLKCGIKLGTAVLGDSSKSKCCKDLGVFFSLVLISIARGAQKASEGVSSVYQRTESQKRSSL